MKAKHLLLSDLRSLRPITPEIVERIAKRIGLGLTHAQAVSLDGVKLAAWQHWMERHPAARALVDQESAKFVLESLEIMQNPGNGDKYRDWRARAWILERRHALQFSTRPVEVTVTTNNFVIPLSLLEDIRSVPLPPVAAPAPATNGNGNGYGHHRTNGYEANAASQNSHSE